MRDTAEEILDGVNTLFNPNFAHFDLNRKEEKRREVDRLVDCHDRFEKRKDEIELLRVKKSLVVRMSTSRAVSASERRSSIAVDSFLSTVNLLYKDTIKRSTSRTKPSDFSRRLVSVSVELISFVSM